MDIVLARILSLIPKNENGKFVHGAKIDFAKTIGLKSGNVISDWITGRSNSYTSYIYQIAEKYNVSVEWLKGETDIKEKPAPRNGDEFWELYMKLEPKKKQLIQNMIEQLSGEK